MIVRKMGWDDWGVPNHKEVIKELRDKVSSGDMNTQLLILDACVFTYPEIASYLYESIAHKKSYDQMPYVMMKKDDFYAYRRKAVAVICKSGGQKGRK